MSYTSSSSRAPLQYQHPDPVDLPRSVIIQINQAIYKVHAHLSPTASLVCYKIRLEPALDPVESIHSELATGQLVEKKSFTKYLLKSIPIFTPTVNPSPKHSSRLLTIPVLYQSNTFIQAYFVQALFSKADPADKKRYQTAYRKVAQTQALTAPLATVLYSSYTPTYDFPIGPLPFHQTIDLSTQFQISIFTPDFCLLAATENLIPPLPVIPPPLQFHSILTKHGRSSSIN
jgi:hypothetical protein